MTFDFCFPARSTIVPDGPDWLHEIKYDGYRLRVERDATISALITSRASPAQAAIALSAAASSWSASIRAERKRPPTEAALPLSGWLQARRVEPVNYMGGCFRLPCSAKKRLALNPWRGALGLFPETPYLFRKALVEGIDLFETARLHVAAPFQ
jgi:hypothetical protein